METKPIESTACLEATARVLASRTFSKAARSASVLRYVADKTVEGRAADIKEYAIALDVFDRANYNSKTDSRVRTEVRKLRDLLAAYYAGEGVGDPVRIEIPVGSYVPVFTERPADLAPSPALPEAKLADAPSRRSWTRPLVTLTILAGILFLGWRASRVSAGDGRLPAIVVMPIRDLTPDHGRQAFCDGLTEELITQLSAIDGLRIVSGRSVAKSGGGKTDVRQVGRELGVHAVLDGSVRADERKLEVTYNLVSAKDGFHLWTQTSSTGIGADIEMQREFAGQIEDRFRFDLNGATKGLARPGTRNSDAWHYYLRASQALTLSDPVKAAEYYRAALVADPDYAQAMAGLAIALVTYADWLQAEPAKMLEEAHGHALRAVQIDPALAESQQALGLVKVFSEHDWPGAEKAFRKAIELDPTETFLRVLFTRMVLGPLGRFDEEEQQLTQARALEPRSNAIRNRQASLRMRRGDLDGAVRLFEESVKIQPNAPAAHVHLGDIALLRGDAVEAMRRFDQAYTLHRSQWTEGHRATGQAALGKRAEAEQLLGTLWSRYEAACVRTALGDTDKAFEALSAAVDRREVQTIWMATEPRLRQLRKDARFRELLSKMRLPAIE